MEPWLTLAITLIALLVVLFIVSYVLNHRTPVPKGCEQIKISEEFCLNCSNEDCSIKDKFTVEKLEEELRKDDE